MRASGALLDMRWDIFCQIVDNYGDAGVCWRLARSLSKRDDIRIRLFCDDLKVLDTIAHGDAIAYASSIGIEVLPWEAAESCTQVADVVIEAFACAIPPAYIDQMTHQHRTTGASPLWINLEYLTAESWADDMHLMPSPQNNGLKKFFYFPGFTTKTGGLIKGDWDKSTQGSTPPSLQNAWQENNRKKISIFNYPHAPIEAWLRDLAQVAKSSIDENEDEIDVFICGKQNISDSFIKELSSSSLHFVQLPFIPQEDYDWLLAHCDFNLVRGEDSFVRAQWAGKPFIWDIYPQSDQAHELKLNAFLERYFEESPKTLNHQGKMMMRWASPVTWWADLKALTAHSESWAKKLQDLGHLEVKILDFVKSQEISR